MASDAPWVASFKCVVKGYQDCRFDVKEGEDQSFKENKGAGARKAVQVFRIVNERGQLDHLTEGPSRGYDLSVKKLRSLPSEPFFGRLINTLLNN